MTKTLRKVIKIDEELCDGCGLCVPACAEGAIQIIDGKAKLVSDRYCDGLGACLGECPQGAISFEEREAEEFDEQAVGAHLATLGRSLEDHKQKHEAREPEPAGTAAPPSGCPSSRMFGFRDEPADEEQADLPKLKSELRQWPVKLNLVSPAAPYFQGAELVLAADCTAFAYGSFHPDYMKGKALAIGYPKFDDLEFYREKLKAIIEQGGIKSITVIHMEVPCCLGLLHAAQQAIEASGRAIPLNTVVIGIRGEVKPSSILAEM